jgi:hypothetical protein
MYKNYKSLHKKNSKTKETGVNNEETENDSDYIKDCGNLTRYCARTVTTVRVRKNVTAVIDCDDDLWDSILMSMLNNFSFFVTDGKAKHAWVFVTGQLLQPSLMFAEKGQQPTLEGKTWKLLPSGNTKSWQ